MEEEKNLGGRPPIYPDTEEALKTFESKIEDYFNSIPTGHPPLVTELTLALDFCDKSTLYDYAKKDRFSHSVKKALTRIESFHEKAVAYGDKCVGNLFVLKNFGWKDTQAVEHSGQIKSERQITLEEAKEIKKQLDGI